MMYGFYNAMGGGFGGMILMIVFWGLVIWVIVRLINSRGGMCSHGHGDHVSSKAASPINIAKSRYARGEINREEFEKIKKDLQE